MTKSPRSRGELSQWMLEADVCRELGIKLVDGLGEKVQSSRGSLAEMTSQPMGSCFRMLY